MTVSAHDDIPTMAREAYRIGEEVGFHLSSDVSTGRLLRILAASKPSGRALEVGTGLGAGAAWILDGLDRGSRLTTLEAHPEAAERSRQILSADPRATVVETDAAAWLESYDDPPFDLAFVDTTVVKFERLDLLVRHLAPGGLLVADDLLPQPKWNDTHAERVARFRAEIVDHPALVPLLVDWGSGLLLACLAPSR